MNLIDVIGCNGEVFSQAGLQALDEAEIVVGSKRLLEENLLHDEVEKVVLDGNIINILPDLIIKSKRKKMAILASGDPLYCGIGATLLRFVSAKELRFFPAITAFQQLFAALGQPWEKVMLYSLHARKGELPYRQLLCSPLTAIYGDANRNAQDIATELIQRFPACAKRIAAVGCNLGFCDEKIIKGTLQEIANSADAGASLSVLALLPDMTFVTPRLPLGLPDDEYHHFKNMITHPEVRAIVLSKLALSSGVMWDIGAGSGSVGIEAAGLCRELQVHSVEKNLIRYEQLCKNIEAEGLPNITSYYEDAELQLPKLPVPDRIFIGGGGVALLEKCFEMLSPNGLLVITGVMVETMAMMGKVLSEYRKELLVINVSRAKDIASCGQMLCAENPITIGVYVKNLKQKEYK